MLTLQEQGYKPSAFKQTVACLTYRAGLIFLLLVVNPLIVNDGFSMTLSEYEYNKIGFVQQQKRIGYGYYKKHTVKKGYESCTFSHFDMDKDKKTTEVLAFSYYFDSEGGYKGRLKGYINTLCADDVSTDDRVLVTYVGLDGNKKFENINKTRVCTIPLTFALYIMNFANSDENNGAVYFAKIEKFIKSFGLKKIANAPKIEDEINVIQDSDGTRRNIKRPSTNEFVLQQKHNGYGYYKKHTVKSGYETCVFSHYDMDRDKNTAEVLAFSYYFDSEGGYKGRLKGYFQTIAADPDVNDRVLATYVGLDGNKIEEKPRICKIPIKFALYILDFINSGENNGAVVIAENELFKKAFGREKIANAPKIEDEINIIQDSDGTRRSIKRPSTNK